MELSGRVALVTGAARRIGSAIVRRLAQAGCHVALHYRSSQIEAAQLAGECRSRGVRCETFCADLSDLAAVRELPAAVLQTFGRLDVLVNNASEFEPMSLEQFDLPRWERTLRVNLTAPLILVHAAHPALRAAGGRVINLCDASVSRPWPTHLAYMVSKGALETLTRVLARALAPEVNVVGVAPGVAAWPEDADPATRARLTRRIPLGRAGTPEDVAAAVHYLLVEGDYVTGTILVVDGGRHLV